ncbi:Bax inhibitor-1/YccA family protein [Coralliovum pocilloporae]|uniref:Bax inhibitor-1/YccA family protein n=1 Tax=Coralliovum pocilloporae TaxID=3066369 RepID=UPI0033071B9C
MNDFNRNGTVHYGSATRSAELDEGLRAYMLRVYNYMAIGLVLTGVAALLTYSLSFTTDPSQAAGAVRDGVYVTELGRLLFVSPLKWVLMLAPLGLVFFLGFRIQNMSVTAAQGTFWVYASLVGVSIATIFVVYTHDSIATVFFVTAAAFAGLSIFGYTTKKDLSGMGTFLIMGLIGIIIASLVNFFLASPALQFAVSVIGVLVFAGLTAYDTQRIKEMYYVGDDGTMAGRKAIMGALSLYLNFINMFMFLLQLFGNRE